jgi:hypothetical protein
MLAYCQKKKFREKIELKSMIPSKLDLEKLAFFLKTVSEKSIPSLVQIIEKPF